MASEFAEAMGFKVIGGKRYHRWEAHYLKSHAEKAAAKRRKNGFKVRITKEHATGSGKGETYRWVVWSRL
jgi:hypothetical protein